MTDPIADMLTRIRNATTGKKDQVSMPTSKMKVAIAKILKEEGYISDFEEVKGTPVNELVLTLKYGKKGERVITGIKRISKPGLRVYADVKKMPIVLGGMGIAILSTSKGLMTNKQAKAENIGGEVLAFVW